MSKVRPIRPSQDHNKVLLIDCDDVLLKWIVGFRTFVELEKNVQPNGELPTDWSMESWLDQPRDVITRWIEEFNNGSWEFGTLPAYADAQDVLPMLKREGWRFVVITSCSQEEMAIRLRKANLYNHFGPIFDEVRCVELGASKLFHLHEFPPSVWVEDNLKNARQGVEAGHSTFMLRRQHNRQLEQEDTASGVSASDVIWVNSWHEIALYISDVDRKAS